MMNSGGIRFVPCPHCSRPVEWITQNRYRPFCSERCKLIDLGEWATERYRIPDDTEPEPNQEQPPRG